MRKVGIPSFISIMMLSTFTNAGEVEHEACLRHLAHVRRSPSTIYRQNTVYEPQRLTEVERVSRRFDPVYWERVGPSLRESFTIVDPASSLEGRLVALVSANIDDRPTPDHGLEVRGVSASVQIVRVNGVKVERRVGEPNETTIEVERPDGSVDNISLNDAVNVFRLRLLPGENSNPSPNRGTLRNRLYLSDSRPEQEFGKPVDIPVRALVGLFSGENYLDSHQKRVLDQAVDRVLGRNPDEPQQGVSFIDEGRVVRWMVNQYPELASFDPHKPPGMSTEVWLASLERRFGKSLVVFPRPSIEEPQFPFPGDPLLRARRNEESRALDSDEPPDSRLKAVEAMYDYAFEASGLVGVEKARRFARRLTDEVPHIKSLPPEVRKKLLLLDAKQALVVSRTGELEPLVEMHRSLKRANELARPAEREEISATVREVEAMIRSRKAYKRVRRLIAQRGSLVALQANYDPKSASRILKLSTGLIPDLQLALGELNDYALHAKTEVKDARLRDLHARLAAAAQIGLTRGELEMKSGDWGAGWADLNQLLELGLRLPTRGLNSADLRNGPQSWVKSAISGIISSLVLAAQPTDTAAIPKAMKFRFTATPVDSKLIILLVQEAKIRKPSSWTANFALAYLSTFADPSVWVRAGVSRPDPRADLGTAREKLQALTSDAAYSPEQIRAAGIEIDQAIDETILGKLNREGNETEKKLEDL